jgi:hypothetical protein
MWVWVYQTQGRNWRWAVVNTNEPLRSRKGGEFIVLFKEVFCSTELFSAFAVTLAGIREPVAACGPTVEKHRLFMPLACAPLRASCPHDARNGATFRPLLPATCHSICASTEGRRLLSCQCMNVPPSQQVGNAVALVQLLWRHLSGCRSPKPE